MIPGIDVSHWQGEIDWSKLVQAGVKFAFIKATEFPLNRVTVYIDDKLKTNIAGAAQNGILWGAYHFFRTHIDPIIQARVFCETVSAFSCLPPVLDLEVAGSKGTKLNEKVLYFLQEVERITNRRPIIYTSGGFWRSYMLYNRRNDADWARVYPLWLAQYTTTWPTIIYPWAGWDFWQYSDKGRLPGIKAAVDLNWYIGSYEELNQRFVQDKEVKSIEYDDVLMKVEDESYPSQKSLADHPAQTDPHIEKTYSESEDDWIKRYFFGENSGN